MFFESSVTFINIYFLLEWINHNKLMELFFPPLQKEKRIDKNERKSTLKDTHLNWRQKGLLLFSFIVNNFTVRIRTEWRGGGVVLLLGNWQQRDNNIICYFSDDVLGIHENFSCLPNTFWVQILINVGRMKRVWFFLSCFVD